MFQTSAASRIAARPDWVKITSRPSFRANPRDREPLIQSPNSSTGLRPSSPQYIATLYPQTDPILPKPLWPERQTGHNSSKPNPIIKQMNNSGQPHQQPRANERGAPIASD